jgi:NTE family protein
MQRKVISAALQGGGSHGAFTWGALDRLLEDERIDLEGLSGASAGALNAVALAYGWTVGGREGAREALSRLWQSIMTSPPLDLRTHASGASARATDSAIESFVLLTRFMSPQQMNPLNVNPLRDILEAQIDFDRLKAGCPLKLFIAATNVSSGMSRIFGTGELSVEVLLASACVPSVHHAVEIDGEAYWDGGLTANPPIRPLLYKCNAADILVVFLQLARRPEVPVSAEDIWRRFSEISFSSALFSELQGIAMAKEEAESRHFSFGGLDQRLRRLNMHAISLPPWVSELGGLSRLDTHSALIGRLHQEGRERADAWLAENFPFIGVRSSFSFAPHLLAGAVK